MDSFCTCAHEVFIDMNPYSLTCHLKFLNLACGALRGDERRWKVHQSDTVLYKLYHWWLKAGDSSLTGFNAVFLLQQHLLGIQKKNEY
jgi:hypothetical protein